MPELFPGFTVPPEATVTLPTVPLPPSVAPEATETSLLGWLPLTNTVPVLTVVVPVWVLLPLRVTVAVPVDLVRNEEPLMSPLNSRSAEPNVRMMLLPVSVMSPAKEESPTKESIVPFTERGSSVA